MSHVTDLKLRIHDLDALEEAAEKCGLQLMRGQKTYAWFGEFMNDSRDYGDIAVKDFGKGAHALRLKTHQPGDYEIGLHADKDGGFKLAFDSWGPGRRLSEAVGQQANRLRVEYAAAVATRKAAVLKRKGFTLVREEMQGGGVRLKLRRR